MWPAWWCGGYRPRFAEGQRVPVQSSSVYGPKSRPLVTVRSSRGLELLDSFALDGDRANRRAPPLPPPSGQRAERRPRPVVSKRRGRLASSANGFRGPASTLGWPVRGVVQPPRSWISGNTDTVWLALVGGWRPTVLPRADRTVTSAVFRSRRIQSRSFLHIISGTLMAM